MTDSGRADALFGTNGADTFVFSSGGGNDRIQVFQATLDTLDLSGTGITSLAELQAIASAGTGAQTIIDFGDGDLLTIGGIRVNLLNTLNIVYDDAFLVG